MTAHVPIVVSGAAEQLATVLELSRRARSATSAAELGFVAVNETHALSPYRQSALWSADRGVLALSGLVDVDGNAPYAQWLRNLCDHLRNISSVQGVAIGDVPDLVAADWNEFFPPEVLWLPVRVKNDRVELALILGRDMAWSEHEKLLLCEWADAWVHSYDQATRDARPSLRSRLRDFFSADAELKWWKRPISKVLIAFLLLCLFPVRLTVLAPGELVPSQPAVMRAPFDGVVDAVLVQPNQRVRRGQLLFRIDTALAASRRDAALEAISAAEAEYRQAAQQALVDDQSRSKLAGLASALEQRRAEAEYVVEQTRRGTVTAPLDGIALFDDPAALIGRPVATGERVLRIADPRRAEIEAWVGAGDAIPLDAGAPVKLYLDPNPLSPIEGRLRYFSYEPVERSAGHYAYRIRASLDNGDAGQIGLRGTAKLSGSYVPLVYWIFRRPLATVRGYTGL
ncbi:MAG: HlyD family efflux transporter periplasmic adaptor subunit [Sandarakinorhabdus sp.]|nr:HlyD family efflux transporter periplasmic adaptor subunit [Sandarakinorhabdus sp.]